MHSTRVFRFLAVATCAACLSCAKSESDAPHPQSSSPASASSAVTDAAPSASAAVAFDAGALVGLNWTESPGASDVPDVPVYGAIGLRHFDVAALYFEPGPTAWRLTVADTAIDPTTHFIPNGAQAIHVDLPLAEPPSAGRRWTKSMGPGGGYFQIAYPHGEVDPRGVRRTMSWASENAYFIAIDAWKAKTWDPKGPQVQDAGRASGKLYVAYRAGHGRFRNAAVAGTFKDAPVRYVARPFWIPARDGGS